MLDLSLACPPGQTANRIRGRKKRNRRRPTRRRRKTDRRTDRQTGRRGEIKDKTDRQTVGFKLVS